ncbi:hypothetical protein [Anaerotignum sp.]|uniref:hypothetical protein n=1 Tax=Anaerotignum sp. TaxID=2039241 RepID=UPI0027154341|nr:hypothetical protein [Anaerotignum sp.]
MKKRLTTKQAAILMGANEQFVRDGLKMGDFAWGTALKRSSRYTYYINLDRFCEEYRLNPNEVAAQLMKDKTV